MIPEDVLGEARISLHASYNSIMMNDIDHAIEEAKRAVSILEFYKTETSK